MRLSLLRGVALASSLLLLLFVPLTAAAAQPSQGMAKASGCSGSAQSFDAGGKPVGSIVTGGAASAGSPFVVDYEGGGTYQGRTDGVLKNMNWEVFVLGVKVMSGSDPNDGGKQQTSGSFKVKDYIPTRVTGQVPVSGTVSGSGGACTFNFWVKLAGDPVGTIPWNAGVGLGLLGLVGLFLAFPSGGGGTGVRRHPFGGLLSGLLLGLGASVLLFTHALLAAETWMPYALLTLGAGLLGLLAGLFGPVFRGRGVPS